MKIPDKAKRVFRGEIFDVYQWEEKNYDGSSAIWERIKRSASIQIIPVIGDKLYLSYEEQPGKPLSLTFLGGRAEEGEDPLVTAKRELLEEAGFESDDWELYKEYNTSGKIDWPIYLFIARDCKKVAEPNLDAGEKLEVKEYSFDAFMDTVTDETFWARIISDDMFRSLHDPEKLAHLRNKVFNRS